MSVLVHARAPAQDVYHDNVVIVLDASGSMSRVMRSVGTGKMAAAKAALKEVLARVPETTRIGLLVFSSRNLRNDWVYPLGPRDDAKLTRAIDLPLPGGRTPLGEYIKKGADRLLKERAEQLGYGSYRLLIVTDGQANDQQLVDRYTPEVIARGITVDVIGVDMQSAHTLARKVHSYRSADDPASLRKAVAEVFAEVGGAASDAAGVGAPDEAFEELAGIPDEMAAAALKALATSGNHPIGTRPRVRPPAARAPVAATPPRPRRAQPAGDPGLSAMKVLFCVGFVVAAAVLAYFARKAGKIAGLIEELPTTPIANVLRGLVEVKGKARAASGALESPYTRTPCVHYHFKVVDGSGKGSRTIINDRRSARCTVEDDTGSCEVDLRRAEMVLDSVAHGSSGVLNDAPERVEKMLRKRYRTSSKGWLFNKSLSYTETVLREGDDVYVLGTASKTKAGAVRITKRGGVFIVSDKSERQLLTRFRGRGALFWCGSAALVAVAVWILAVV